MQKKQKIITLGRIAAPYGLHGWLKIRSFTEPYENILHYQPLLLKEFENWREVDTLELRHHGCDILIKFADCNQPETARKYTGKEIGVHRSELPELTNNQYYWSDLEGLTVLTEQGDNLGKVIRILDTGANDVIHVKGDKEYLIPYIPGEYVLNIDLQQNKMQVNWDPNF